MLRLEVTPGRVGGHHAIRAIHRPIPASAGSSPRSGEAGRLLLQAPSEPADGQPQVVGDVGGIGVGHNQQARSSIEVIVERRRP